MARFSGSWSNRLSMMFLTAMACAGVALMFVPRGQPRVSGQTTMIVPPSFILGIFFGGFLLCALIGLMETFAAYLVDDEGVTRRGWNGTRSLKWKDLERFNTNGQQDGSLTLIDSVGRRFVIRLSLLSKPDIAELRALLEPHLALLRERQLREIRGAEKSYYPERTAGIAILCMEAIVVFLLFTMRVFTMPVPPDQRQAVLIMQLMLGAMLLLSVLYAVHACSRTLTFDTREITDRSLFRTRRIAFRDIKSVTSRMRTYKNGTYEQTTIQGARQRITITSMLPDYKLLLTYIQEKASQPATQRGVTKRKAR